MTNEKDPSERPTELFVEVVGELHAKANLVGVHHLQLSVEGEGVVGNVSSLHCCLEVLDVGGVGAVQAHAGRAVEEEGDEVGLRHELQPCRALGLLPQLLGPGNRVRKVGVKVQVHNASCRVGKANIKVASLDDVHGFDGHPVARVEAVGRVGSVEAAATLCTLLLGDARDTTVNQRACRHCVASVDRT